MEERARIIGPRDRPEPLEVVGTKVTVLRRGEGGDVTLQRGPEGSGPPPHRHPWGESFYVLEGTIEFLCDGESTLCEAGSYVHVPGGVVHTFRYGAGGGAMLEFTEAGSRSAAMFTAIDAASLPGPPDVPTLVRILVRHGARVSA